MAIIFYVGSSRLSAQVEPSIYAPEVEQNSVDAFVVNQVNYNISGRTKEKLVRSLFGNLEQKGFESQEILLNYLNAYKLELMNSRYFFDVMVFTTEPFTRGTQQLVDVEVFIYDTLPIFPIPYAIYTTSDGFTAVLGGYLPNTGGLLFDTQFTGLINFPMRDGSPSWNDPTWSTSVVVNKIKAGPTEISINTIFSDQRRFIIDRGTEVYRYRSMELAAIAAVSWPFADYWRLDSAIQGSYTFNNSIYYNDTPNYDYGVPYGFSFTPSIGVVFNHAPYVGSARQGSVARFGLAYVLTAPKEHYRLLSDARIEARYGKFWQPTPFFFPNLTVDFYWKTGIPEFNLGRFTPGIIDSQWRGNGGLFLNSSFTFKVARWEGWIELHTGPSLGYGIVFEPGRAFTVADQGFTVGIETLFLFDIVPSVPLKMSLAWDLRNRPQPAGFIERFELSFTASFDF